jgi:hypothetical protein
MTEKDVLCPICGEVVNPDWCLEDGKGVKFHVHCYTLNRKEVPQDTEPRKPTSKKTANPDV